MTVRVRKTGNFVFLRINGSPTATFAKKTWVTLATLSEEYRPTVPVPPNTFFMQSSGEIFAIQIATSGEVQIYPANNDISSGSINVVTVYSLIN